MSVQSASSIGTGPSPLACRLNEPRNFSAPDSAAASARASPASLVTTRVVVVPGQQSVGQRAEADQPAAHRAVRQVEGRDAARHHDIGHRRAGGVEEGGRLRHPAQDRHAAGRGATVRGMLRAMTLSDADAVAALIRAGFAAQAVVQRLTSPARAGEVEVRVSAEGEGDRAGR